MKKPAKPGVPAAIRGHQRDVMKTLGTMLVFAGLFAAPAGVRADGDKANSCRTVAVAVVEAAIASLGARPNQMSLTVNATGVNVGNTGGTGIEIR